MKTEEMNALSNNKQKVDNMLLNLNENKLKKKNRRKENLDLVCSVVKYECSLYLLTVILRRKSDISYKALHSMPKKLFFF